MKQANENKNLFGQLSLQCQIFWPIEIDEWKCSVILFFKKLDGVCLGLFSLTWRAAVPLVTRGSVAKKKYCPKTMSSEMSVTLSSSSSLLSEKDDDTQIARARNRKYFKCFRKKSLLEQEPDKSRGLHERKPTGPGENPRQQKRIISSDYWQNSL